MQDPHLDAKLLGYLRSIPPEHHGEIDAAVRLIVAAQRKGSWTRALVVGACTLAGGGFGAGSYAHNLATKSDIKDLEVQYAEVAKESTLRERVQDDRLTKTESVAQEAYSLGLSQQLRLDRFTIPGGGRP